MPIHPTAYAKRAVFKKVGAYDISYHIAADYEWMIRAFEIHKIDNVLLERVLTDINWVASARLGSNHHGSIFRKHHARADSGWGRAD